MELTQEERGRLATAIVATLDDWGLDATQQIGLIGLPETTRPREMIRYRRGAALPQDDEVIERCQHIIGIRHTLELLFPHNPFMSAAWVTDPGNRHFPGSAAEVMLRDGLQGMRRVRNLLERGSDYWT